MPVHGDDGIVCYYPIYSMDTEIIMLCQSGMGDNHTIDTRLLYDSPTYC